MKEHGSIVILWLSKIIQCSLIICNLDLNHWCISVSRPIGTISLAWVMNNWAILLKKLCCLFLSALSHFHSVFSHYNGDPAETTSFIPSSCSLPLFFSSFNHSLLILLGRTPHSCQIRSCALFATCLSIVVTPAKSNHLSELCNTINRNSTVFDGLLGWQQSQ